MESGKFVVFFVIILILIGGTAYFSYSQIQGLQAQVDALHTQTASYATAITDAKNLAAQAKTSADGVAASVSKAGDIAQLTKQAADSAAAAAKSATEAQAAATAAGSAKPTHVSARR